MRIPKYRVRKGRNYAYVEMDRERITRPGPANYQEGLRAYRRAVDDYLQRHAEKASSEKRPAWKLSVSDLVLAWLNHCKTYYANSNTRSNEYDNCRFAVRPLNALCGDTPIGDFRPQDLRDVREAMLTGQWSSPTLTKPPKPWSQRQHQTHQADVPLGRRGGDGPARGLGHRRCGRPTQEGAHSRARPISCCRPTTRRLTPRSEPYPPSWLPWFVCSD